MSEGIVVTTGDLKQDYEVLGIVRASIARDFSGTREYGKPGEILSMYLRTAFDEMLEQLEEDASLLGADAIIGVRENISVSQDVDNPRYGFLQMYGTAVKME